MNSKNEYDKKDLCLAYSQGNMTAYPPNIESMARYLSTQYSNKKPANQQDGKKGDTNTGDDLKFEDKDSNTGDTVGAPLGILQQLKNPLLLAEGLISALTPWKQVYSCLVHHILWRIF